MGCSSVRSRNTEGRERRVTSANQDGGNTKQPSSKADFFAAWLLCVESVFVALLLRVELISLPRMKLLGRLVLAGLCVVLARAITLDELAADPAHWPAEVTVTATTKATQIRNGQPAGMMLVGVGKKLVVTGIGAEGVTGKLGGATIRVAADKTDLLKRLDPAYVPEAVVEEPAAPVSPAGAMSAMHRRLSGKLLQLGGSSLQEVPDARLAGVKYYGLYYSASWCGPCRAFTPGFINTYRQMKQKYPQFEVVFISSDHNAEDMRNYVKGDAMPWLVLKYDLIHQNPDLLRYRGDGIPCLVLVDATGKVLSDSFNGANYLGPGHVLQDAIKILENGG
jgi:nucleoredoxin